MPSKEYLLDIIHDLDSFSTYIDSSSTYWNNITTLRTMELEDASCGVRTVEGGVWRNGWSLVTKDDHGTFYVWDILPDKKRVGWREANEDDIAFLKTLAFPEIWEEQKIIPAD